MDAKKIIEILEMEIAHQRANNWSKTELISCYILGINKAISIIEGFYPNINKYCKHFSNGKCNNPKINRNNCTVLFHQDCKYSEF